MEPEHVLCNVLCNVLCWYGTVACIVTVPV